MFIKLNHHVYIDNGPCLKGLNHNVYIAKSATTIWSIFFHSYRPGEPQLGHELLWSGAARGQVFTLKNW
jgi:hypothetical protein